MPLATNNPQLEFPRAQGQLALQLASLKPLDDIVLRATEWQRVFEELCALIAIGKIDATGVDHVLSSFIMKVEGTLRTFQCGVPLQKFDGGPFYCTHQVQRKDRILRHIKNTHLDYRPFVCGGKCKVPGW